MDTLPVRALGNRAGAAASAPLGGIKLPTPPARTPRPTIPAPAGSPKVMQFRSHTRYLSMTASLTGISAIWLVQKLHRLFLNSGTQSSPQHISGRELRWLDY